MSLLCYLVNLFVLRANLICFDEFNARSSRLNGSPTDNALTIFDLFLRGKHLIVLLELHQLRVGSLASPGLNKGIMSSSACYRSRYSTVL